MSGVFIFELYYIDKSFYACNCNFFFTKSSLQVFGGSGSPKLSRGLSGGVAIPQIRRHSFAQIVFKNVKYNNIRQKIIILAAAQPYLIN